MTQKLWYYLSTVSVEPTRYLWDGMIPLQAISVIEGEPASGKSTLITDIASRVTNGHAMPLCSAPSITASHVLLISNEMSLATHASNFRAAGADLDKIAIINQPSGIRIPEDVSVIQEIVSEIRPKLVVVDPITDVLSVSINNDQGLRKALSPLQEMARIDDFALVVIRHLSKSASRAVYAGAGSIGLTALARSVLLAARHPTDRSKRVLSISKSNVATPSSIVYRLKQNSIDGGVLIDWIGNVEISADELLIKTDSESCSQLEEAEDFLFGVLQDGPQLATWVLKKAAASGISQPTLRRAKKNLGVKSVKKGFSAFQEFRWELPKDESKLESARGRFLDPLCDQLFHGSSVLNLHDGLDSTFGLPLESDENDTAGDGPHGELDDEDD
jgi:archaellum biogenesis ATPase FlaH